MLRVVLKSLAQKSGFADNIPAPIYSAINVITALWPLVIVLLRIERPFDVLDSGQQADYDLSILSV
ncbi:uncharacterized protein METZ01_LOCUS35090 [marine metagenome]|uniref:Uncharacterized protein n=1 Tax=marine metagenome TaxID=408172 RepID=A0A381QS71_9ZZZZ